MKTIASLLAISLLALLPGHAANFTAQPDAAANVFEQKQPLVFQFHGPEQTVKWSVQDWHGAAVAQGDAPLKEGADLHLEPLPPGSYELTATAAGQPLPATPFGIVATPAQPVPDSPYALDSAQNSIIRAGREINPDQPKNDYAILARLIHLSGVSMSRERINWPSVLKPEGGFNWSAPDQAVNGLAQQGIPVLNLFTRAPDAVKGDLQSVPRDLIALFKFSKEASAHFRGKVTAWEFWNEPDDQYCLDSAWDFAAAQKAAYLGLRAGDPAVKVLIGSNATFPTPRFVDLALQNDAGAFFDIYNFHTYAAAGALPKIVGEKQALLRKYGLAGKPIWLTETGLQNEGMGGAAANIAGKNVREHSPEQEMQQARFLVYSLLTAQARGVARTFFFALPPYNENDNAKVWGLLRWNWTAKPGFIALSNLTAQLGRAKLLGVYDLATGTIAYLFQRGDEQVLVAWADHETEVEIPGGEKATVVDFLGRAQPLASGTAMIGAEPQYFTNLHGLEPIPTLPKPEPPPDPSAKMEREVVFSVRFLEGTKISNRVIADLGGESPRKAELFVTNFSSQPKKISLTNRSQGITCQGLPASITVPAEKALTLPFSLQLSAEKLPLCFFRMSGTSAAGEISQLYVPIKSGVDPLSVARAVPLPATAPGSWAASASAMMASKAAPEADTLQFIAHFPPNSSRWIYPKFDLRGRKIDFTGSIGISFEIRLLQPQDPKAISKAYLMLYTLKDGKNGNYQFAYKPGPQWKKVAFTWNQDAPNGFEPATVVGMKIGMNPNVDDVAYEVRNPTVYYSDQAAP